MRTVGSNNPAHSAARAADLVTKSTRQEKDTDVLMYVSSAKDKTSGDLKAQFRGVGTASTFQKIRNAFLGRTPATQNDVVKLFMQRGMSAADAGKAMSKITLVGGNFSASDVKKQIFEFEQNQRSVNRQFSETDGKFLADNVFGKREFDLKDALNNPIDNYEK